MAASHDELADRGLSVTAILARYAPVWGWLRANFGWPAVCSIAGVAAAAALWIWNQHVDLQELKHRDPTRQLTRIEGKLEALSAQQSSMLQQQASMSSDVAHLSENMAHLQRFEDDLLQGYLEGRASAAARGRVR